MSNGIILSTLHYGFICSIMHSSVVYCNLPILELGTRIRIDNVIYLHDNMESDVSLDTTKSKKPLLKSGHHKFTQFT
jgi:hypothetical protein